MKQRLEMTSKVSYVFLVLVECDKSILRTYYVLRSELVDQRKRETDSWGAPPVSAMCWLGLPSGSQEFGEISGHRGQMRVIKRQPASN